MAALSVGLLSPGDMGHAVGRMLIRHGARVAGREIGQASGLKMCYAAQTKGFAALATELLVAARRMGLYDALIKELELSQAARYASLAHSLPGMPVKARRWVGEMEEIAKTFAHLSLTPQIYQGAADMYRLVSATPLAAETPENMDRGRTLAQVIDILAAVKENGS